MSKETKEQPAIDIEAAFDKTQSYVEQNRKSLILIVGGMVALVGIYFAWKTLIQKPNNDEAAMKMYKAEMFFAQDSFKLASKGSNSAIGFDKIVDDYGMTTAGNTARYYLGASYLRTGEYDKAIEALQDYDSDDMFTSVLAIGMIGDAYMEKGNTDEAIEYYLKAARKNPNKLTSPVFLKKAAYAYEDKGQKEEALKLYEQIRTDFPESQDAPLIDKYITRDGGAVK